MRSMTVRLRLCTLEERVTPMAGQLDPSIGARGVVTASGEGWGTAVDNQGRTVVVGDTGNGVSDDVIAIRYLPTGQLDASFGVGGEVIIDVGGGADEARDVAIDSQGRIVIGCI